MKSPKVTDRSEITKFDPKKISKRIAGTQGLMKAYEKAGDLDGFIKALDDHIKATKEFVAGYKKKFPPVPISEAGPGRGNKRGNGDVTSFSDKFLRQYIQLFRFEIHPDSLQRVAISRPHKRRKKFPLLEIGD